MSNLLEDPMVQAGVAPFLLALLVAFALSWSRLAWLALAAGIAITVQLSTGIGFTPLSASRKIVLLVLLAPLVGLALDLLEQRQRTLPALPAVVALLCGLAGAWVFQSVIAQREGLAAVLLGGGVAAFVAALVYLTLRLRGDGVAAGAATVGLGVGVGVAAILSASLGNMMNAIALGVSGGALMLLQFLRGRPLVPGWIGTLTAGVAASLFAAATFVLAELPWYALPLLLAVPAFAALPLFSRQGARQRMVLLGLGSLLVASATILAAWLATRVSAS